jgi:hypothetical protein
MPCASRVPPHEPDVGTAAPLVKLVHDAETAAPKDRYVASADREERVDPVRPRRSHPGRDQRCPEPRPYTAVSTAIESSCQTGSATPTVLPHRTHKAGPRPDGAETSLRSTAGIRSSPTIDLRSAASATAGGVALPNELPAIAQAPYPRIASSSEG